MNPRYSARTDRNAQLIASTCCVIGAAAGRLFTGIAISQLGMDFGMPKESVAIWFGILVLMTVSFGLLSPPVGPPALWASDWDDRPPVSPVVVGVAFYQGPRKPASEVTLVNNPASQVGAKG